MQAHYHGVLRQRGRIIMELGQLTGFPRWCVNRQARRVGLTMQPDRRACSREEIETLARLMGKVSVVTIAKRLKRT